MGETGSGSSKATRPSARGRVTGGASSGASPGAPGGGAGAVPTRLVPADAGGVHSGGPPGAPDGGWGDGALDRSSFDMLDTTVPEDGTSGSGSGRSKSISIGRGEALTMLMNSPFASLKMDDGVRNKASSHVCPGRGMYLPTKFFPAHPTMKSPANTPRAWAWPWTPTTRRGNSGWAGLFLNRIPESRKAGILKRRAHISLQDSTTPSFETAYFKLDAERPFLELERNLLLAGVVEEFRLFPGRC